MATLTESLSIRTGKGESYNYSLTENYTETFSVRQEVDNSDGFIKLLGSSTSISAQNLQDVKSMVIKNNGLVGAEIQFKVTDYADSSDVDNANSIDISGDGASTTRQTSFLLGAGEYIFLPNVRWVSYENNTSAANAKPTTNGAYLTLDANEWVDTTIDIDNTTATNNVVGSATNTLVYLEQYTSAVDCAANYFHVGDLIRLTNEIMEVTAIGDKSDLANNTLTVIRGVHGTTADGGHSDDDAVMLPFFNAYHDYDKYSVVQTNNNGRFKAHNFFGFGRVEDSTADGIVPGSIAGKFYLRGYQALGLSGITPQSNSGLAASTAYGIDITVDGGSLFQDLTFTTDASNLNFGGTNGVIKKIQDALDTQYYTAGNLFEKKVFVGIVDGDIRFTSGQNLSTSAILLGDPTGGATTPFSVGRFPDIGTDAEDVNAPVASKLPEDTIINSAGVSVPNVGVFFYDDGHGRILGSASGSINYTTGKIDFTGPPNSEFVITANYDSAHGGGANTTSTSENVITTVSARSCNSKINVPIEIVAFN